MLPPALFVGHHGLAAVRPLDADERDPLDREPVPVRMGTELGMGDVDFPLLDVLVVAGRGSARGRGLDRPGRRAEQAGPGQQTDDQPRHRARARRKNWAV